MDKTVELFISLYVVVGLISGFLSMMITLFDEEDEDNLILFAFHIQRVCLDNLRDEINATGLFIILVLTAPFLFPGNILLGLIWITRWLCGVVWRGFKYVFKRREVDE